MNTLKKALKNTALAIALLILVLFALIWVASPPIARWVLSDALAQFNLTLNSASSIRINLFISRLTVSNLSIQSSTNETTHSLQHLQIDYSLWRLIAKEVHIDQILLDGMTVVLQKQGDTLMVAGIDISQFEAAAQEPEPVPSEAEAPQDLGVALSVPIIHLKNITFHIDNDGHSHSAEIKSLKITGSRYNENTFNTKIRFDGRVDTTALKLESELAYNGGNESGDKSGDAGTNLNTTLALDINNISPESVLYLLPDTIEQLTAEGDISFKTQALLQANTLRLEDTQLQTALKGVHYQDAQIGAHLESLEVQLEPQSLEFKLEDQAIQTEGQVTLTLNELKTYLASSEDTLLQLGNLDTGLIEFSAVDEAFKVFTPKIGLENIVVSKAHTQENTPALFESDGLFITELSATQAQLEIQDIALQGGKAAVEFSPEGNFNTLVDTQALTQSEGTEANSSAPDAASPTAVSTSEETSQAEQSFGIRISKIHLPAPLYIAIDDQRNSFGFKKIFGIHTLNLSDIDSTAVHTQSPFEVQIKDEAYFNTILTGWVQPFAPKLNLVVNGDLKEFPLYEVAPYLKDTLGFEVETGQLDAAIKATVTNDIIESKTKLLLRGAKFTSSQKVNDETNLIGQTAIPLNVALNMLRDGNGDIELKIPVDGDLQDPDISLRHIIGLVIKKVAISQAKTQLLTALVPYAKVVSVAVAAGGEALKVRFENLPYAPGQIEPGQSQAEFIQQFGTLLKKKADLRVSICPVGTPEDLNLPLETELTAEQYQQLQTLSADRAKAFKAVVVSQFEVPPAQLLLCTAKVDSDKKAKPLLDFKT